MGLIKVDSLNDLMPGISQCVITDSDTVKRSILPVHNATAVGKSSIQ